MTILVLVALVAVLAWCAGATGERLKRAEADRCEARRRQLAAEYALANLEALRGAEDARLWLPGEVGLDLPEPGSPEWGSL